MQLKLFIIFLLYVLSISNGQSQCPDMDTKSHPTQNELGNSSYHDIFMGNFFGNKYLTGKINLNKPILIVGAGYGAGVAELITLGAKFIYLNDLSNENLACAKKFITKTFPLKKNFIQYIPGNISNSDVFKNIPDNSLGIVYAKNIIPFLDARQLFQLIKDSNYKLESNGLLIFVFENPVLDQQIEMVQQINLDFERASKKDKRITLDDMVKNYYHKDKRCSDTAYESTPKSLRMNGFPCIMYGNNFIFNLLMPSTIESLLRKNGFEVVDDIRLPKREDTFVITAKKK